MNLTATMTYFAGPIVLNERESAAIGLMVLAVTLLPLYLAGLLIGFRIRKKLVLSKLTKLGYILATPFIFLCGGLTALFGSQGISNYEALSNGFGVAMGIFTWFWLVVGISSVLKIIISSIVKGKRSR